MRLEYYMKRLFQMPLSIIFFKAEQHIKKTIFRYFYFIKKTSKRKNKSLVDESISRRFSNYSRKLYREINKNLMSNNKLLAESKSRSYQFLKTAKFQCLGYGKVCIDKIN